MRLALVQFNPTVGDVTGNAARILKAVNRAQTAGADLVVFPELSLVGYPPRDLLYRQELLGAVERVLEEQIAPASRRIAVLLGAPVREADRLYNAALFFHRGVLVGRQDKTLLPSYDVFDETRYFKPAARRQPVVFQGETLGLTVCEDVWNDKDYWNRRLYEVDPVEDLVAGGTTILINISASPYHYGKRCLRADLLAHTARKYGRPIVYVNQVGGNDELIFDGSSLVVNERGEIVWEGRAFAEDLGVVDTRAFPRGKEPAAIQEDISWVGMPSRYSSPGSLRDAEALAHNLGIAWRVIPIEEIFTAYLNTLNPKGEPRIDVAEENVQARIRGNILMFISNREGYLVLSTGNKSELAVGYCTLYGDMSGGLSVLADVPKMMVYELARYINREREIIPAAVLTKAPSAELRAGQRDEDSLPPYRILDPILKGYIEENLSSEEIAARGFDLALVRDVIRRVDRAEFKRRQAAPGLKVTTKAFGMGRRLPVAWRPGW
uniref:Glutamine-dependent NAD(+) synthetase n=1 Tax=Ammonifex degensii TaxID=42838 RepID=A0A7C2IVK3_9THEO